MGNVYPTPPLTISAILRSGGNGPLFIKIKMSPKETLPTYYESTLACESERSFFLTIADYMKYAIEAKGINEFLGENTDNYQNEIDTKLLVASSNVEVETKECLEKINPLIEELKEISSEVKYRHEELQKFLDGSLHTNKPHTEDFYRYTGILISSLVDAGKLKFVKQQKLAEVTPEGRVKNWTFSPTYSHYKMILREQTRWHRDGIWGTFGDLYLVYELHYRRDEFIARAKKIENPLKQMDFYGLMSEWDAILEEEEREGRRIVFKHVEYKDKLRRIHPFLLLHADDGSPARVAQNDWIEPVEPEKAKKKGTDHHIALADAVMLSDSALATTSPIKSDPNETKCGDLILNLHNRTLSFRENPPHIIKNTKTQAVRLLNKLMSCSPTTVPYIELAQAAGMKDANVDDHDLNRQVNLKMKYVRQLLKKSGMTPEEVSRVIVNEEGVGQSLFPVTNSSPTMPRSDTA